MARKQKLQLPIVLVCGERCDCPYHLRVDSTEAQALVNCLLTAYQLSRNRSVYMAKRDIDERKDQHQHGASQDGYLC